MIISFRCAPSLLQYHLTSYTDRISGLTEGNCCVYSHFTKEEHIKQSVHCCPLTRGKGDGSDEKGIKEPSLFLLQPVCDDTAQGFVSYNKRSLHSGLLIPESIIKYLENSISIIIVDLIESYVAIAAVELVGNRPRSRAVDKCVGRLPVYVHGLSMHLSMVLRRLSINPQLLSNRTIVRIGTQQSRSGLCVPICWCTDVFFCRLCTNGPMNTPAGLIQAPFYTCLDVSYIYICVIFALIIPELSCLFADYRARTSRCSTDMPPILPRHWYTIEQNLALYTKRLVHRCGFLPVVHQRSYEHADSSVRRTAGSTANLIIDM